MSREEKIILKQEKTEILTCDICGKTGIEKHDFSDGVWMFFRNPANTDYIDVCPKCHNRIRELGYFALIEKNNKVKKD